jgi:hypothetical protein
LFLGWKIFVLLTDLRNWSFGQFLRFIELKIFILDLVEIFVIKGEFGAKENVTSTSGAMNSFSSSEEHGKNTGGSGEDKDSNQSPEPPISGTGATAGIDVKRVFIATASLLGDTGDGSVG